MLDSPSMLASPPATRGPRPVPLGALLLVFFASGAAALIYQVLWLKDLGRLFGVMAYAAATTLAVFFAGLALGGLYWGRRAAALGDPMRTYALLEVGIALSAMLYFGLFDAYGALQGPLFGALADRPALTVLAKIALATGVLLLPSFLMGGTLPVLAQFLVRSRDELGARATLLYSFNTVGAAAGAMAAGFVLPRALGFRGSYLLAMGLNLGIAAVAWRWRGRTAGGELSMEPAAPGAAGTQRAAPPDADAGPWEGAPASLIVVVAAVSGLATLGLEVIWTRMFAQVLQNSVYTFSIILTVFLACLALGSALAHHLCRRAVPPRLALAGLLTLSGLLAAVTPLLFLQVAGAVNYMKSGLGFSAYIATVFAGTALVIGPAVIIMGAVFPYLMKLSEEHMDSAGRTVGQLAAVNTTAAIAGSLLAGFLLLRWLEVEGSIRAAALAYLLLALTVWPWGRRRWRGAAALPLAAALLLAAGPGYSRPAAVWLDTEAGEELVEAREGPAGSVSVVRYGQGDLRIRVNSSYSLGSTASAVNERLQGQIPLALHPDPRSVFFLGLGTGLTASGALDFPLERIVVCEINADVVWAAREHFGPWLNGLFRDPRVRILAEDGRTWLAATQDRYDVIVSDIFLSFKEGAGSLYTREHFRAVREHLEPGGLFVQWLPLFDISEQEFGILARTLLAEFPGVTLWRRSLSPRFPVYAMVARLDEAPLDPDTLDRGLEILRARAGLPDETWLLQIPFAAYAGNLSALAPRFAGSPINTDNWTVLEYTAPVTERDSRGAGRTQTLAWGKLLEFSEGLLAALPPERDPHLARLSPRQRHQVHAGVAYYGHVVSREQGRSQEAEAYLSTYRRWLGPAAE